MNSQDLTSSSATLSRPERAAAPAPPFAATSSSSSSSSQTLSRRRSERPDLPKRQSSSQRSPSVIAAPQAVPTAPPRAYRPSALANVTPPATPAPPVPTLHHSSSATLEMPSASYTGLSLRTKAGALWSKSVAPRVESAALGLSRGIQDLRERREWDQLSTRVGFGGAGASTSSSTSSGAYSTSSSSSSLYSRDAAAGATDQPQSRWSYFTGRGSSSNARAPKYDVEEKVVCFPGWATLRPSTYAASEPAMTVEVLATGYCYSLKPLHQASRTQRVFYSLAKSFAALPKLPPGELPPSMPSVESLDLDAEPDTLQEAAGKADLFEQLVDLGGKASDAPGDGNPAISRPPPEPPSGHRLPDVGQTQDVKSLPSVPPRNPTTSRRVPSTRSTVSSSTHDGIAWPRPLEITAQILPRLHENLAARLLPFFATKLPARKIRLTVFPVLTPISPSQHTPESTVPMSEACQQAELRPLASKVLTTLPPGGSWSSHLQVRSKALRRLLDETGRDVASLGDGGLRVRVVAELLEDDTLAPSGIGGSGGAFNGYRSLRVVADDDAVLDVCLDGGVRVISDIDDTVKWTEVLAGTKTIFRNVFVRELEDVAVPGMAEWYQSMSDLGVRFHYVSNMPQELWSTVKDYLATHKFPAGSVKLKEYGGAGSAIARLWEEPGQRKRAGVEDILKEFPHCRFILVGDSGEQDLDLYVSLAQQYPAQVIAIYIRDVTTPLPRDTPILSSGEADASPLVAEPESFVEPDPVAASVSSSRPSSRPGSGSTRSDKTVSDVGPSVHRAKSAPAAPQGPLLIDDPTADALSPNNPLRPSSASTTLQDERAALIEAFQARVRAAKSVLPPGIKLHIFRHGGECADEGLTLARRALGLSE